MPEYSALTVAEKIDLLEIVQSADKNSNDFISVGKIIKAMIKGGPVDGIEKYEQAEELIKAYIDKARLALPDERIYSVLNTISLSAEDDESVFQELAKEALVILSSDTCMDYMREKVQKGECLCLASKLGIDCSAEIKAVFQKNWRENDWLLQLLDNPNDIVEMTSFFINNVEDKDFLTPKNNIIGGSGNSTFEILLPRLHGYSLPEAKLLELGTRTKIKRNRSMSLERLREWKKKGKLNAALKRAINNWRNTESDKELLSEYQDL